MHCRGTRVGAETNRTLFRSWWYRMELVVKVDAGFIWKLGSVGLTDSRFRIQMRSVKERIGSRMIPELLTWATEKKKLSVTEWEGCSQMDHFKFGGQAERLEFSCRHVEFQTSTKHPRRDIEYIVAEYRKISFKRQIKTEL